MLDYLPRQAKNYLNFIFKSSYTRNQIALSVVKLPKTFPSPALAAQRTPSYLELEDFSAQQTDITYDA